MALNFNSPAIYRLKNVASSQWTQSCVLSFKPNVLCQTSLRALCAMNMTEGQMNEPGKLTLSHIVDKAINLWDSAPQPVKSFPWNKAFENFIQLILDLVLSVVKYLSIPLYAITSISEMSYCAHEKKSFLVPFPFLIGVAVAGVLREAALESSPPLKNKEVPWHLIANAIFFTLLKLPGPYYPYWGRVFIPHFANGALLRILWSLFLWYRRPQKSSLTALPHSVIGSSESRGV